MCVELNSENWFLNLTTCDCYEATPVCPVPINPCTTYDIAGNVCTQVLEVGATSWSDEMCANDNGENWFLNLTTCNCYEQTIIRSASFSDAEFEVYSNADPSSILQLDISSLPAATTASLGINYYADSAQLATQSFSVSGTTSFTTRPWTVQQTPSYTIQRLGNIVFLWMQGVTAVANSPQQAITAAFIPVSMRPTQTTFMSIPGASGSLQNTISVAVSPGGSVAFSVVNGQSFASSGTAQYASFNIMWRAA
jgi:hypothetical protein